MTSQIKQPTTNPRAAEYPVSLGGADIGRCITRLHHDRFTEAVAVVDEVAERRAKAGIDHETAVIASLVNIYGHRVVQIDSGGDPYDATADALKAGADLILGGRIASPDGLLVGAPDALIRYDDGYLPIEIKGHFVLGSTGFRCATTPITNLFDLDTETEPVAPPADSDDEAETPRFRGSRKRDLYQVAHYWNILDSLGLAGPHPIGGVIGTEDPLGCAWVGLEVGERSILSTTRQLASDAIEALTAGSHHPERASVGAYWRGECGGCPWRDLCRDQLERADDPTLLGGIGPETRAVLALHGVTTTTEVADLPLDTTLVEGTEPILIARARTSGRILRRRPSGSAIDVPEPTRQVDFDIETYRGRIYLAGFLETVGPTSTFNPIADWSGNEASEGPLIEDLFDRLASYADGNTKVFYWTRYEPNTLSEAAERWGLGIPGSPSVDAWFDAHAIDLHRWIKQRLVSESGYGLKAIAPQCGFDWRDDDPGGQQSEIWFEQMLAGDATMQARLLDYNEDDVLAQLAIRRWIIGRDSGSGPGSSIPSVLDWPQI